MTTETRSNKHTQSAWANHLSQWQEAVWLLIAIMTPLFVNLWVEQQFEASKVWLLRALVFVLGGLLLAGRMARNKQIDQQPDTLHPTVRILIVAFFSVLTLSTLLSPNRYIASFGTLERANGFTTQACYILLFYIVAVHLKNNERSQRLINTIIFASLPICLLGLAQAAGWQPLSITTDARTMLATTLGRSNFTGAYLAMLLPLTLSATRFADLTWQRIGYGSLFGLQFVVVLLTQARAAWIASVVGIATLLWLWRAPSWSRRTRWLSAIGGSTALFAMLLLVLQRGIASGGSIAARWTIWQASLRLLWPRLWLGYGADTLELHFPSVYPPQLVYYQGREAVVDRAHNWLLDWSLSYGIVATGLLVMLIGMISWRGWLLIASTQDEEKKPLTLTLSQGRGRSAKAHFSNAKRGDKQRRQRRLWLPLLRERAGVRGSLSFLPACLASITAYLIGNLFLFEVAATATLFWLLLAIIVAASSVGPPKVVQLPIPQRALNAILLLAVAGFGWAIWIISVQPLVADLYSWRGTQALGKGERVTALANYQTAAEWQPQRAAYHVAAGLTAAGLGDFESADLALRTAIALRPTDPQLYTQLATVYAAWSTQDPQQLNNAFAAYQQAITLAPTIAQTYQQYADTALRAGDVELAQRQALQAVTLDATDGISFGILGWAQLQLGKVAEAQTSFEQAVRWVGDSADFHLGLATAHYQLGNMAAAQAALAESLTIDQTYRPALELQLLLDKK